MYSISGLRNDSYCATMKNNKGTWVFHIIFPADNYYNVCQAIEAIEAM